MSKTSYTYAVIRYVHDPAAGESLNIGVVLWAPATRFLGARLEVRYERLSNTFAGFDGDHYKRALGHFESSLASLHQEFTDSLFLPINSLQNVQQVMALVWPDEDLSFRIGPMLAGIGEDPELALDEIFHRFVESQYPQHKRDKRSDEEVWSVFNRPLIRTRVSRRLAPKVISTDEFSLKFDHSFKNGRWHVLEPVSMDYARPESLQKKATAWLGNATAIEGHPELATLYLLLGKPQKEEHKVAYNKAKNLLRKMPIEHVLVEEDEAEEFAKHIAAYMRAHGILDPTEE